jgi:hypothetical protein
LCALSSDFLPAKLPDDSLRRVTCREGTHEGRKA